MQALETGDIPYFTRTFAPQDQWRIIAHYREKITFFDIETTGLGRYDTISVIACYHRNEIKTYVEAENLDDFLDILDETELLVSFNGSSFDIPKLLDNFRIPQIPCPHLDMRWVCYHHSYRGGLKTIANLLGIERPQDLNGINGYDAVHLWHKWQIYNDLKAKHLLLRYCCADVILLKKITEKLLANHSAPLNHNRFNGVLCERPQNNNRDNAE